MANLHKPDFLIWDARSQEEYDGIKIQAARGGHIPGAIHLDWMSLLEAEAPQRLKPLKELQKIIASHGFNANTNIVTHCQTHRRSGLTYFVGKKLLDFKNIKAYPGSWAQWGNNCELPIENILNNTDN